jgi:hypothetical protein
LWHEAHDLDDGCVNLHDTPVLWHEEQADFECPPGRLWQFVHVAPLPGCLNLALANATFGEWQAEQVPE